jgi:hypothetical protein
MIFKRLFKAGILLGVGLNLASCGGFVADHWPHWAGGLPADAPPRPGSPGYDEFIAHGQVKQVDQDAANPRQPQPAPQSTGIQPAPVAQRQPASAPMTAPVSPAQAGTVAPADDLAHDSSVVNGGLY